MSKNLGFTMAEILLSLTIIGVVAAITLPSLMANINERTWNTQRKALYARMSQAIAMMPQLNGYGEYEGTNTDGSVTATKDTAAEAFLTEGLSKVLKINNICDSEHLADCGIAASFINIAGSVLNWPTKMSELNNMFTSIYSGVDGSFYNPQKHIDTKAAAFETQNGESLALYYNPNCVTYSDGVYPQYTQPHMCANFIYDLNGNKGPNTVGKDIGWITALYPTGTSVVAPVPLVSNLSGKFTLPEANSACLALDSESRLPNIEELSSMFYNHNLFGGAGGYFLWSRTMVAPTVAIVQNTESGQIYRHVNTTMVYARCIKR